MHIVRTYISADIRTRTTTWQFAGLLVALPNEETNSQHRYIHEQPPDKRGAVPVQPCSYYPPPTS